MKSSKPTFARTRMRVTAGMFIGILIVVGALHASVLGERLD